MWSDLLLVLLVFVVMLFVAGLHCLPEILTGCWHKWSAYTEPELMNGSLVQQRKCFRCNIVDIHIEGKNLEKRNG
jgi:hypothetical protein